MLQKTISIRTVCKRNVKNLSVFHCLLHTTSKGFVIVFRFDNSNGLIGGMKQEVISFLSCLACMYLTLEYNSTIGKVVFHSDMFVLPPCAVNGRCDITQLYIFFGQIFLTHSA